MMHGDQLRDEVNLQLLRELSEHIHDINFTARVSPFDRDPHAVVLDPMEAEMHLRDMLHVQEQTGITASALFNNIYVPPTHKMLALFVENFKPLYDMGIRSITIPHTLWLKWGLLRETFPDLRIKQTVLRNCRTAQDFWNFAEAGFDYVNIDRVLARDFDELKRVRRAQQKFLAERGRHVHISLLLLEGCLGACPFWMEHYQHTLTHPNLRFENCQHVLSIPMAKSCAKRESDKPSCWERVDWSPFREDVEELCRYIDNIKIGGRRDTLERLYDQLRVVHECMNGGEETLITSMVYPSAEFKDLFDNYDRERFIGPRLKHLLGQWRTMTRTCEFQCWNCDLCEQLKSEQLNKAGRLHQLREVKQWWGSRATAPDAALRHS